MMIRKGAAGAEAVDQATEMTTVTDPFLGQTGSSTDHSRQESADSGLGESDSLHQSIDSVAGTSGLLIVFKRGLGLFGQKGLQLVLLAFMSI